VKENVSEFQELVGKAIQRSTKQTSAVAAVALTPASAAPSSSSSSSVAVSRTPLHAPLQSQQRRTVTSTVRACAALLPCLFSPLILSVQKPNYVKEQIPQMVKLVKREIHKGEKQSRELEITSPAKEMVEVVRKSCWVLHNLLEAASDGDGSRQDKRESFVTAVISILLFRDSQRSSWLQKRLSLFLLFHRCPKVVFQALNRCGLSLSYTASLDSLRDLSKKGLEKLETWKQAKKQLMGVVDNINFRIVASEEISTTSTRTVNATIGFLTPMRVKNPVPKTPGNLMPQLLPTKLPADFYFQTEVEWLSCKKMVVHLIGRVLADHVPGLEALKKVVSSPLPHPHSEDARLVTDVQGTEILFLDENKSEDIPGILDYFMVRCFVSIALDSFFLYLFFPAELDEFVFA